MPVPRSEPELAAYCVALGAGEVSGWSAAEKRLVADLPRVRSDQLGPVTAAIRGGRDPLGASFCRLRTPAQRRSQGATYTPAPIVRAIIRWAQATADPVRVVDPGVGSARFLVAAAPAFPRAALVGVEIDPLAALTARANLAVAGLAGRAEIRLGDYCRLRLGKVRGSTLFVGNPPYVRHHQLGESRKAWLTATAKRRGFSASQLAGLHVHFFLATLVHARPGDVGALITAAEWLDVNYGRLVRELLVGPLGLVRMDLVEPSAQPFEDAQTTAVITGFQVGEERSSVAVRRRGRVGELEQLSGGRRVSRQRLADASRWTPLSRRRRSAPADFVELGELCHVRRGQVTGANKVWIIGQQTPRLPPGVLVPSITRARELLAVEKRLDTDAHLRRVIDLPEDLGALAPGERELVERFVRWARGQNAHKSYVALHRKPWWAVKMRPAAPILATYMARRCPAFVRNDAGARHINIAHGLYPREDLSGACLDALALHLSETTSLADGRTYAGGLTKFEPKEMERLLVPTPDVLVQRASASSAA